MKSGEKKGRKETIKPDVSMWSKVKSYLNDKFNFRLNVLTKECEISTKHNPTLWTKVNVSELRGNLDRHGLICSLELINCILNSLFVKRYHPIEEYFLAFEDQNIDDKEDYIQKLAGYVQLKDPSPSNFQVWYTHLKKWMIRAIQTVFDAEAINKHALILCSAKSNIGKSHFCEFLCPPPLLDYYNNNFLIGNEKDAQRELIRNFIIDLDDFHDHHFDSGFLRSLLSQCHVTVYASEKDEEDEAVDEDIISASRISSFIGSANKIEFLSPELGYSRWVPFEIAGTKRIDSSARALVELSWRQAYYLYKIDADSGELTKEEVLELEDRAKHFTSYSTEHELIEQYLSPSTKEEGKFMTTTDIFIYLQNLVGSTIRLNSKLLGSSLRKIGFERVSYGKLYGYWVNKR